MSRPEPQVPVPAGPLTVVSALARLSAGELSAQDLLARVTGRADAQDGALGVYLHRTTEAAQVTARDVDRRRSAGTPTGPLAGVPLAVKDIILTADAPTTGQSLLRDRSQVTGDAPVSARLRAADAVLTGKTTTMEFALGFSDPDKPFPTPRNPWDLSRWTGGSSSGTASGIATGMFLGGLGTDTAGSVRMPAAWCGVTGHKPTYGLVPRTGVLPLGWTLDHVGPLARTAEDCALLLSVMAGPDGRDPTVATDAAFSFAAPQVDLDRLRIGLALDPMDLSRPEVQAAVRRAVEVLAAAGARVREVRLPVYEQACSATLHVLTAEALAYHRRDLRSRWSDFGRPTRAALLTGALVGGADYVQAQRVRRHAVRALDDLFEDVDVVLGPTATGPAPKIDDLDFGAVVSMLQTTYWDAVGNPALSVPMGRVDGLPVGLQVVGRPFADRIVLDVGRAFQALTDHHLAVPPDPARAGGAPAPVGGQS